MIGNLNPLARFAPRLLGVLVVCLLPASVDAQTVVFRNECRASVVVQTATVVNGVLVHDSPCLLRSMEATPRIPLKVNKIVTVWDAKSNRILYRSVLRATPVSLAYGIVVHPRIQTQVVLDKRPVNKVKPGKMTGTGMTGPGMAGKMRDR